MNIARHLADSALRTSRKTAIVDVDGPISYKELFIEVERVSERLVALGIGAKTGVGIMARNGIPFIVAALAALRSGAVILPIHHQIRAHELNTILESTGLHAIIHDRYGITPSKRPQVQLTEKLYLNETSETKKTPFIGFIDNPAYVRFTSGTTGASKGVILTHEKILERIIAANDGLSITSNDIIISVLPMAFHLLVSTILYLYTGATIVLTPDHLADTILDYTERYKGTILYASPMHFRLLSSDTTGRGLNTIRSAISTSSGLPIDVFRSFYQRYKRAPTQAYGIIEVGLPLVNAAPLTRPLSVGSALSSYEVATLDTDFSPKPTGTIGHLAFRGKGLFSGYLDPPTPTEKITKDGWFLSGDQATIDSEGYVTILGRTKSAINVAGNKVFPEEVEEIIDRYPVIERSRVMATPHDRMGEVVHADVILKTGSSIEEFDTEELISFCRRDLSSFKVPFSIEVVTEIETTASGKTSRAVKTT